jgi:hypothetical protein
VSILRLAQLAARRLEGSYDLAHLQEFHRFIFQDIYSWAGQLRSVSLAKPGSMFALPEHIESYTTKVLRRLSGERHLRGLPREEFAERLTHYYRRSTRFTPSERATDVHSAPSCASSLWTPAIPSPGSTWTRRLSSGRKVRVRPPSLPYFTPHSSWSLLLATGA